MDVFEKLQILSDAAKYDVACTSSGSERKGKAGAIGNSVAPGICHTFSADGRCISLLKIRLKVSSRRLSSLILRCSLRGILEAMSIQSRKSIYLL